MTPAIQTVGDLNKFMVDHELSPEKLGREVKISNMTIRRLLAKPPETPLPEKYQALLKLQGGASLFQPRSLPLSKLFAAGDGTQGLFARRGQAFDSILTELEQTGNQAIGDLTKLDADVEKKLEDKAIDSTLRKRVRKVTTLLRAGRLGLRDKALLAGALLYLINPIDLIPDTIPVVGYLDDLAVLTLACDVVARNSRRKDDAEARALPRT